MNNVINSILEKAQLDSDPKILNKSLQIYNQIQKRVADFGKPEYGIIGAPVSVQLACESLNIPVDKKLLVKLSAYPEKTYNTCMLTVRSALGLEKQYTAEDLCIRFSIHSIVASLVNSLVVHFLALNNNSGIVDHGSSEGQVYLAAAFLIISNGIIKKSVKLSELQQVVAQPAVKLNKAKKHLETTCQDKIKNLTSSAAAQQAQQSKKKNPIQKTSDNSLSQKYTDKPQSEILEKINQKTIVVYTMVNYSDYRQSAQYKKFLSWKREILSL